MLRLREARIKYEWRIIYFLNVLIFFISTNMAHKITGNKNQGLHGLLNKLIWISNLNSRSVVGFGACVFDVSRTHTK